MNYSAHVLLLAAMATSLAAESEIIFSHDFDDEPIHTYMKSDLINTWNSYQDFAKNSTIKIVHDPDPEGTHGHVMRAFYAANTVHNRNGSGFYFRCNIGSHNEMYFSYDIFFEEDAEFTKGGKLPGLGISDYFSNSGVKPDGTDRWTGGLAWRKDGKIANYVYHANQSGKYGDIFLWKDGKNGQAYFKRGEWNRIEIYYKMNTPGVLDGSIKGWLNGELALDSSRPMYRMPGGEHLTIGAMAMATMYGGGQSFAPSTDQYIYFDNFVVSTEPITHRQSPDLFNKPETIKQNE
jgi:hypothetical protein